VKIISLSEIIASGRPCNLKTLSIKARATWNAVKGCFIGMKWAYLENIPTTTRMQLKFFDVGSPSIKSRLTTCQA
jgi:hypothetical protein